MKTTVPLTPRLLALILAVQDRRQLAIHEAVVFESKSSWFDIVCAYIKTLPLEAVGLRRNNATILTLAHGSQSKALIEAQATEEHILPSHFAFSWPNDGIIDIRPQYEKSRIIPSSKLTLQRMSTTEVASFYRNKLKAQETAIKSINSENDQWKFAHYLCNVYRRVIETCTKNSRARARKRLTNISKYFKNTDFEEPYLAAASLLK